MDSKLPTILVADDHVAISAALAAQLEREDFKVIATADHAGLAVAVCQLQQPNLCLLDIVMPGADPVAAVGQIRILAPKTKVLFYSEYGTDSMIDRAIAARADGFVLKDEPFSTLVWAIRHVIAGHTYFSPHVAQRLVQTHGPMPKSRLSTLSNRESEVLHYMAQGWSCRAIAQTMGLSPKTVEKHQQSLRNKLDIRGAVQLTRFAIREGLVAP